MSTSAIGWIEQSGHAPKRKRAGLVCIACHEKKIKCDLQRRDDAVCSHCLAGALECRVRTSRRGGGHRHHPRPRPSEISSLSQRPAAPPPPGSNDDEAALCTPPASAVVHDSSHDRLDHRQPTTQAYPRYHPGGNYLYPMASLGPHAYESPTTPHAGPSLGTDGSVSSPLSNRNTNIEPYLNESGFLQVYSQEHRNYTSGEGRTPGRGSLGLDDPDPDLLQSFTETYFTSCYAWCPVLDRETLTGDLSQSSLLLNAVALVGSHIQPPLMPATSPATYYQRAKGIFYSDDEVDPIKCLQSVCLFYWWSPRPSFQLQKDSAWWWTATSIRLAQQMGLHREPRGGVGTDATALARDRGLRRRIWWTLFARERITAICQGRPCLIDPDDCNVPLPTLDDFPGPADTRAEVFIYWVKLCSIIGRVAKYRSRVTDVASLAFPSHLADELIRWAQTLPQHLKLPIETDRTTTFDRDVHQLHLPYLAVIIILHLSPSPRPLPRAYVPAVAAASCIARIFRDYLARGSVRFLMSVAGWICGIATLALLRASRLERLTRPAEEDIRVLVIALKELRISYPVADMFLQGYERLRAENDSVGDDDDFYIDVSDPATTSSSSSSSSMDWMRYFPYLTTQTSGLANALLTKNDDSLFLDEAWLGLLPLQLQEPFGQLEGFPLDIPLM